MKNPFKKFSYLRNIFKVLNKKQRIIFSALLVIFIGSTISLVMTIYYASTTEFPAYGGSFKEGVVGQPRFINPVYGGSNDVDRDLINLIYSSLFKYDITGQIVPDLVDNYYLEEGDKIYNVTIKQGVKFHDNNELTVDDIIFTVNTIQNPDFKSPLQARWLEVETEKISEYQMKFILKNPYPGFLETLTTKILPSHIWKDISSETFPLSSYNYEPIGSGPYKLKSVNIQKDETINSLVLTKNNKYYAKLPYIKEIKFLFFDTKQELVNAGKNNIVDSLVSNQVNELFKFNNTSFTIPRYYALFLNTHESELLNKEDLRMALHYGTDKNKLIENVLHGEGKVVTSPFLPEIYYPTKTNEETSYNPQKAEELLASSGLAKQNNTWVKVTDAQTMNFRSTLDVGSSGSTVRYLQECLANFDDIYPDGEITSYFGQKTKEAIIKLQEKYSDRILTPNNLTEGNGKVGPSTREVLNEICIIEPGKSTSFTITITTSEDELLVETANELKNQWEALGIPVEVDSVSITDLKQDRIRNRSYDTLLFGQVLGIIPDPFPFWHSSQRFYPGSNLSSYKNKDVDKLLEEARIQNDLGLRYAKLLEAQDYIEEDMPAIFLFNPYLNYFTKDKIKGVQSFLIADTSHRFIDIENWYVNTKRRLTKEIK